jgi:DNA-binding response OmpR family regulator
MNRILLADDDAVLCTLYAEELASEGYEVVRASDGSGLMEVIGQSGPDLIILDIKMGEYDGLDLLQDIRRVYYNIPVILCSAYSSFKYDLRSIAADYYVVKSADLTELKIKINMALQGNLLLLSEKPMKKVEGQGRQNVRNIVGR